MLAMFDVILGTFWEGIFLGTWGTLSVGIYWGGEVSLGYCLRGLSGKSDL